MSFVTEEDSLLGPALFRLAGLWNGIYPRPAMTFWSNAMLWAECGAYLCDVCSRVVVFAANSEYCLVNLKFRIMLI
jgi:hypothetical protein